MNKVAEKFLDGTGYASEMTKKERLALIGVHAVEAIGGTAMVAAGIRVNVNHGDLAGFLAIPGCFIGGHGVWEGIGNSYLALRGKRQTSASPQ
jgi:hypothetical protein